MLQLLLLKLQDIYQKLKFSKQNMAFKTLPVHLNKAKWLGKVKTQGSQIPHGDNYWGTRGKGGVSLLFLQLQEFHACWGPVEFPCMVVFLNLLLILLALLYQLIHSCMSQLQTE